MCDRVLSYWKILVIMKLNNMEINQIHCHYGLWMWIGLLS